MAECQKTARVEFGVCPACGERSLSHSLVPMADIEAGEFEWCWTCVKCKAEGYDLFKLEYDRTFYITKEEED